MIDRQMILDNLAAGDVVTILDGEVVIPVARKSRSKSIYTK